MHFFIPLYFIVVAVYPNPKSLTRISRHFMLACAFYFGDLFMWFTNALVYQCQLDDYSALADLLSEQRLKPCPPHARFVYGWVPLFEQEYAQQVIGATLINCGKEERLLPRSVLNRVLNEKIQALETTRGYPVKRAEKAQLAQELEFQLLPDAFCVQKHLFALFDNTSNHLIINTSSANQASQLLALLRKSAPSLQLNALVETSHLSMRLTRWVLEPETLPAQFSLSSTCVLSDLKDETKRLQCKGYALPCDEIESLIQRGLCVTELSLIWNERIEFTLTHDF
ncbi:MAG: hypothetical protein B7X00_00410, partial [Legionella sp. 21-45-4]